MLSPAKNATTPWGAIRRFVTLTMFVVFSMISHHAGFAARFSSHPLAAHGDMLAAHHCPGEDCMGQHDGQVSCCALGYCGVPLPAPPCASAPLALSSAYPRHLFDLALRWANPRVDRPPKLT